MDFAFEKRAFADGFQYVAGVDEAGRGALAGPVVAAAIILPTDPRQLPDGINDSKKLSRRQREALFPRLLETAVTYGIGIASRTEIDQMNILQASLMAMSRAVRQLKPNADLLLIDGRDRCPTIVEQRCIIDGDALSLSIAAASVLAKVTRDRIMCGLHAAYPLFGFATHMGYGTVDHRHALQQFGPCQEHRTFFKGVR